MRKLIDANVILRYLNMAVGEVDDKYHVQYRVTNPIDFREGMVD